MALRVMMGSRGFGSQVRCEGQLKARWKNRATQKEMMLLNGSHANFRKRSAAGKGGGRVGVVCTSSLNSS